MRMTWGGVPITFWGGISVGFTQRVQGLRGDTRASPIPVPHTHSIGGRGGGILGGTKCKALGARSLGNAAPARTHTTPPAKAAGITPKQPQKCPVGGGTHPEQGQRSSQHCRQPPLPPQNTAPAPPGPRDSPLPHTSGGRATRQGSRGLCSRDGNGGDGRDWRGPRLAAKPPPLASVRQGWT